LLSPPVRTAPVLTGGCHPDDGSPALWPWIQILRNAIELASPGELNSALGPIASDVAHWLPELRERLPGVRGSRDDALRSHEARFRLFDGIANFLVGLAAQEPITLAIEDLQWADPSSLGLVEMVARAGRDSRMLVVATWRGRVSSADDAVGDSLAEIARHLPLERIPLPGLAAGEIREWIQRVLDAECPDALTEEILQRTEGNPFFVEQVLLQLRESSARGPGQAASDGPAVPPGVRDAVHHRLRSVPSECRQMLGVASVFGRQFSFDALRRVVRRESRSLLRELRSASDAQIVRQVPSGLGRYEFCHALIQEALYTDQDTIERAHLHGRIAEALEELHARQLGLHLTELARHFLAAGSRAPAEKSLEYSIQAARQALNAHAYEEAAGRAQRALEAMNSALPSNPRRHGELLLLLAQAKTAAGEYHPRAHEALLELQRVARKHDLPELLACAALALRRDDGDLALDDRFLFSTLHEALDQLGESNDALRARLLSRLAYRLWWQLGVEHWERGVQLSRRAVEIARRTDDAAALAEALNIRLFFSPLDPDHRPQLDVADEVVRLGRRSHSPLEFQGRRWRLRLLLERGDRPGVDRELEACLRYAEESKRQVCRIHLASFHNLLALMEGRLQDGERTLAEMAAVSQQSSGREVNHLIAIKLAMLRALQGRLAELDPVLSRPLTGPEPSQPLGGPVPGDGVTVRRAVTNVGDIGHPAFRLAIAFANAELGRLERAREYFEAVAENDFEQIRPDYDFLVNLAVLAMTAEHLDDRPRARVLYDRLLPYADFVAVAELDELCLGSVGRSLGILATMDARWDDATRHFESALATNERIRARAWVAYTQHDFARMLHLRGQSTDQARAVALASEALTSATD
ncbi:MAG: hypothetical protein MJE66_01465, partial [Proteobacteria bacterium]|nr:hypothetical protein [Pseudomonadota bacterium]